MLDKEKWFINDNGGKGVSPHTIKKFELINNYVDEWARIILEYAVKKGKQYKGIIFVDCMSNSGIYLNRNKEEVFGTPIRVAETINKIMEKEKYSDKKAFLLFNDYEKERIDTLESKLSQMSLSQNVVTGFYSQDTNVFLQFLKTQNIKDYNILLLYDPYQAEINWSALSPFLNEWGEIILNHMIFDTVKGSPVANKTETIKKYEMTYQTDIENLLSLENGREKLEKLIEQIMLSYSTQSKKFISAFPFFNSINGLVYNLIHFTHNRRGFSVFKKCAWKTFGDQSSNKNSKVNNQQLNLDGYTSSDENCLKISDVANCLMKRYKGRMVTREQLWSYLENHPIFPSEGYRNDIIEELKKLFGVKVSGRSNLLFPR